MKPRIVLAFVAALLALGHAPGARAQAQPDTAGLADSVASTLMADVARTRSRQRLDVEADSTAFDSAVAGRLRAMPEATLPPPLPGHRDWVGIHGVTFTGDTATVQVRFGTSTPPDGRLIDMYIETHRYVFVRDASGWRFVRRDFVSGADFGTVRG